MTTALLKMTPPEMHNGTLRTPIDPSHLGTAVLDKSGEFEAGTYHSFTLTYTAGRFGVDDSGSIRVVWRFATDQTNPQFDDPTAAGYTEVVASNNAVLQARFDPKGNIRPWDRTLQIKVVKGFMKEGDTITVRFGVTDHGGPGMRLQTFCESRYEFRVLVDPIATYNFQTLPEQPAISIVPGAPENWVAVVPSTIARGEPFSLKIKAEDTWGNPTNKAAATLTPKANQLVENLPEVIAVQDGDFATTISNLKANDDGPLEITLHAPDGSVVTKCNPAAVAVSPPLNSYWGDLHGQSDETLGTNSAADYFAFGRDKAFLDACAHQGNDFQMTDTFWKDLNKVTQHFNQDGEFVTLPGYEWSGNTALGGDRNVFFPVEGRTMRRSSHALIEDQSDAGTDCHTAGELFEAFAENQEWDVICFAHCGGRYADITMAHDGRFEKSVEVHSAWGTFEWIVQDAFKSGYRVGIIGNSDGHKGRPGASYPGAGWFGAVGGLTCFLMPELTRDGLIECINTRHHYATTGGPSGRMRLEVTATFDGPATQYFDDPLLKNECETEPSTKAMMGDIIHLPSGDVQFDVNVNAASPVRCIDIFNGIDHLECHRPYGEEDLGNRIGVLWEGAEYRGRFRAVPWDGEAHFDKVTVAFAEAVNFFNRDKKLDVRGGSDLEWQSVTTGNFAGFIATLENSKSGSIALKTALINETVALADIGYDDTVLDASDILPRGIRLFRLPDDNPHTSVRIERKLKPQSGRDNPFYVRVTLEDGTQAWSSPIYVLREILS
ncbi:MAG: DUF3604 domain-containing protein [Rhizobiaceae bacterium]